jgi:hypothetical protein
MCTHDGRMRSAGHAFCLHPAAPMCVHLAAADEGRFVYTSGMPYTFNAWAPGANTSGGPDCGSIRFNCNSTNLTSCSSGFDNVECAMLAPFICSRGEDRRQGRGPGLERLMYVVPAAKQYTTSWRITW